MRRFFCAALLTALPIAAREVGPDLYCSQAVGASHNPLGVIVDSRFFFRSALSQRTGLLWNGTKVEAGLQNEWTPADNLLSVRLAVVPIAPIEVIAKVGYYRMFDALGFGALPFEQAVPDYSTQSTREIDPVDANGVWIHLSPSLRLKVRQFLFVNSFSLNYLRTDLPRFFLEVRSYQIHRAEDLNLGNSLYALYEVSKSLLAGLNHSVTSVRHSGSRSQRFCAMLIVRPALGWVSEPHLVVTGGVYTEDRLFAGNPYLGMMAGGEWGVGKRRVEYAGHGPFSGEYSWRNRQ